MIDTVSFSLNGQTVEAQAGETIWQVADASGHEIPHLCYSPEPDYRADGNCRACMVEIEGERVLPHPASANRAPGMKVNSASDRARDGAQDGLRNADRGPAGTPTAHDPESKFWNWASDMGVESRFPARETHRVDQSHTPCGQPRRLHPLQSLRPRLPRGPGQRRDRHGL